MPDHLHLFVRITGNRALGIWIRGLKRAVGAALNHSSVSGEYWQPGFFDHVIRHTESYAEKWLYVRDNPVRQKLVVKREDWPHQGEIINIESV
jgi:REP element-mobilizing transposase RayT